MSEENIPHRISTVLIGIADMFLIGFLHSFDDHKGIPVFLIILFLTVLTIFNFREIFKDRSIAMNPQTIVGGQMQGDKDVR